MSSQPKSAKTQNRAPSESLRISPDTSPSRRLHSRSMPATPSQRPITNGEHRRSPSVSRTTNNNSPRSESSQTPAIIRKPHSGCKYETGMARARRRVPYSLGPDKLGPEPVKLRKQLSQEQEEKLTTHIQELYEQLLPTPESEERRTRFVQKLERILHERWPSSSIKVNVFGSTGNNLGTSDSDVDVCITTDSAEMARVCSMADLLAKNGMQRVVCVSSAKVPIVKLWDPELQVACDLNVNNPIALENTTMIRNYVAIDPRVRPLAMIIKHWAKRRILNDAALGGTLSSYTWICLTLNFLQTRKPPILPSLQQQSHLKPQVLGGVNVSFDKNLDAYRDFGTANKTSLGQLLFQFFRYYGFDYDFEQSVVSVRNGAVLSKKEKSWNLLQDNRLCVEEPFNLSRNLANTADDTSMRGIHLELRRAFSLVSDGQLDQLCEQYQYLPEEVKSTGDFVPPTSRPVIAQIPPLPTRGGNPATRGGRNAHLGRNTAGNSRRSSNPAARGQLGYLRNLPFQMTTQELQMQAQHQQHLLHDQLFQQYQYLQLQEQELRARLNQQRQRGLLASGYTQSHLGPNAMPDENLDTSSNGSFGGLGRTPMSAPLYQQRFAAFPYLHSMLPVNGISTNPSSPHLSPALPDTRRFSRRTSVTQSSAGASLRAQSQPARTFPVPMTMSSSQSGIDLNDYLFGRQSSASSNANESAGYLSRSGLSAQSYYEMNRRPAEYVGYYVGQSPSLVGHPHSASISPIPSHVGLAIHNGGLSPRSATPSPQPSLGGAALVQSASANFDDRASQLEAESHPVRAAKADLKHAALPQVHGSTTNGMTQPPSKKAAFASRAEIEDPLTYSASTSEDFAFDTPSSSDDNAPDPQENGAVQGHSPRVPTERTQPKAVVEQMTNGHNEEKPSDAGQKPSLLPYPLGRQLSAVQEVRTPSPGTDRGHRHSLSASSVRSSLKTTQGKGKGANSPSTSPVIGSLAAKPNAIGVESKEGTIADATNASSWQVPKPKRRHKQKKIVKSENDAHAVNPAGGEFLPVNETERKGG